MVRPQAVSHLDRSGSVALIKSRYRPNEYNTEDQPPDPISACTMSLVSDLGGIGMAIADMPREIFRSMQRTKEPEASQDRPQSPEKPAASQSETSLLTPPTTETDSRLTPAPSVSEAGTANSTLAITSHSNASQPTLSDASSTFSTPLSPGSSNFQGSTIHRPSRDQLKQAFGGNRERSSSPTNYMTLNAAVGTGKGVGRIVSTGAKTPMNFCLGLARGFRNMPRLYNDDTIRPVEKVTGLGSGIMVAGKELGYGVFDGIAGLVTQPLKGAEKEGVQGLVKGFGKGIGGLVAKPAAGESSKMEIFEGMLTCSRYLGHSSLHHAGGSRRDQQVLHQKRPQLHRLITGCSRSA